MGDRRQISGEVIRRSGDKTVVVRVERLVKHPVVKKYIRRRQNFSAHDATNRCQVGDRVVMRESRPLSKRKRWTCVDVVKSTDGAESNSTVERL